MDKDYVRLIATVVSKLPLKKQSTIVNKDDAAEILELCNGYIGEIVNLIKASAIYAIKNGSERVTIKEIRECGFNTGPFIIPCQSGKIIFTQGMTHEDRNRCRAICS